MKKCQFCAEEVQDAAVKCRYCGGALTLEATIRPPVESSEPTMDALKADSAKAPSPAAAVAGLLIFAGLFLLLMGGSEYYGGSSTQTMYRGTILERDADANRIASNAMSAGKTKIGFGVLALLCGLVAAQRKASSAASPVAPQASASGQQTARRSLEMTTGSAWNPEIPNAPRMGAAIAISVGLIFLITLLYVFFVPLES